MKTQVYYTSTRKAILRFFMIFGFIATLIMVSGSVYLYFLGATTYIEEKSLSDAKGLAREFADEIESALYASEYLSESISTMGGNRVQVNSLLQVVLLQNTNFEGVYSIWEPNEFDQMDSAFIGLEGHDDTGRFMPYWTRDELKNVSLQASLDYESSVLGPYYTIPKKTLSMSVIDPFLYPSRGRDIFMLAAVCPINYGSNFYGITAVNIPLKSMQKIVLGFSDDHHNAKIYVLSTNGTYVAHNQDPNLVGQSIHDVITDKMLVLSDLSHTDAKASFAKGMLETHVPIIFKGAAQKWSLHYSMPLHSVVGDEEFFRFWLLLLLAIIIIVIVNMVLFYFLKNKLAAIELLVEDIDNVSSGRPYIHKIKGDSDFAFLHHRLESIVDYQKKAEDIFEQAKIGSFVGTLPQRIDGDNFANKLNNMVQALANEQEYKLMQQETVRQERWIRDGVLALNQSLRKRYAIYSDLADAVLPVVINYLGINQGGIFTLIEREQRKPYLELSATYAYSKHKLVKRKVNLGDGIVGTCALERETTYLTEIPDDYPSITSGTGGAVPKAILVAPLLHENIVYGVIELASFSVFSDLEIDLVKNITEPIAAAIASVKQSANSSKLVETMRKNREELLNNEKIMRNSLKEQSEIQKRAKTTEDQLRKKLDSMQLEILRLKNRKPENDSE